MPDPLEVLRSGDAPVRPDRRFAFHLRRQLERELTMSVITEPRRTLTPYLAVAGAGRALDWYREVFGGRLTAEPVVMADGRIGHAELEFVGGAMLMLSEEHPEIGVAAPSAGAGAAVTMHLEVPAVDPLLARAVAAGAHLERPAADHAYGRNAVIRDPFGHRWMISGPVAAPARRHGDIGYVSLWVPDADRAAAFFASVLGWTYAGDPPAGQGRQVVGQALPHGITPFAAGPATLYLCYAVADLEAAVAAVRQHGGVAGRPTDEPFGRSAMCRDDQGVDFALYQPPEGVAAGPRPDRAAGPGDLEYITMGVDDSARARAFYGEVLGWTFHPGRVEDGWQVDDVDPLVGLWGGTGQPVTVPLYRVADLDSALDRVRTAGGTAGVAERMPYGRTSECTDDQGTRFYLMEA